MVGSGVVPIERVELLLLHVETSRGRFVQNVIGRVVLFVYGKGRIIQPLARLEQGVLLLLALDACPQLLQENNSLKFWIKINIYFSLTKTISTLSSHINITTQTNKRLDNLFCLYWLLLLCLKVTEAAALIEFLMLID